MEGHGKKTAITSVRVPAVVVILACFVVFGIVNLFNCSSQSVRILMVISQPTDWRSNESLAYSFRIPIYSFYTRYKISTIPLHEDGIFCPVIIFIISVHGLLKLVIIFAIGVEYRT